MRSRRFLQQHAWTIPLAYAFGALLLGTSLPRLETRYFPDLLSSINHQAAMAIFSSVASGMLALTGIVFSLAFVMVQFNATAYSPRLVVFMARDRLVFHAIGTFTATFLYALMALAWVGRRNSQSVPLLTTFFVVFLLIASVIMLTRLVQRLAQLKITTVLAYVGKMGRRVIAEMYPAWRLESEPEFAFFSHSGPQLPPVSQTLYHIGLPRAIASFNLDALLELAVQANAVIEMTEAVGETAVEGLPLLRVRGALVPLSDAKLRKAVRLATEPTFEQDPKHALRLLVDISIRALSPAINDPTTAVQALDYIEDLLRALAQRRLDIGSRRDAAGNLRVVYPVPTWEDFLTLALDEIRAYGAHSIPVMRRMRALLRDIQPQLPAERRASVQIYLERVAKTVERSFSDTNDRQDAEVEDRHGVGMSRRQQFHVV